MCGIWLFLLQKSTDDIKNFLLGTYDAFMKTAKRGPDRSTFEVISQPNNVAIGFHRLSIMDPSVKGDQPFKIENNFISLKIVFHLQFKIIMGR